ncbi:AMP-dependent synthetase and ligase [Treponema primitia ZAS-2]|uniref:AMP-dependent synthetase and ligase n=1 Tax=Treponema primitia (strain ATCC BAA-887 / DSM 12427 / ZAS-2) TaxID=545694 RepID=F5YHT5_TREPZ|nr:AMP-binding protein [Treponema primitia]AEF86545.1 AMP-dependent synthetase and ligase [Treponema primitia ZAS-2]
MMLNPKDYIADWPDMPHPNFSAWLGDLAVRWGDKTAIFYRSGKQKEFTRWSFTRLAEESRRIGRGLLAAGLSKGDRVALWSENRPEWIAVWLGAAIAGLVIVPIDFLVSEDECSNILKLTGAKAFFYSGRKREYAADLLSRGIPAAVRVCISQEGDNFFEAFGTDAGEQKLPATEEIAGTDPVSIVFTSGTTGFAKGVTLSHQAILANANAAIRSLRAYPWDIFINVLPLHHTYPTTCSFVSPLSVGAATIIVEKLVGKVVIDDIRDAGGTFLIAVPLLYDKVKAGIEHGYKALPGILRAILDPLRKIALEKAKKGNYQFGQRVFKFIRKKAGLGSIRIMVAGGGPLNPKTADFFDSLGFNIVHGYGMSENGPLISVSTPWHKNNVSVGLPVKYTDVKIIDKNEEGIGEIIVKSPSIMLGYYENPEATAAMFTPDGYLKTGDLGFIDDQGFIYISGRAKNLIVSSGGKNVYPEEIETHFDGSRAIAEMLVVGRREPDYGGEEIFAVTVPNFETLQQDYPDRELDDAFLRGLIKKEIEDVNRTLPGYKKISDFTIRRKPFEKNAQQKIRRFMYKSYEEPKK